MLRQGPVVDTPQLVGRHAELALLRQRLEAIRHGHGSLILIKGEAGIGKTSLALALAHQARDQDTVVALGRCYEGTAPAFGLWQEIMTELVACQSLDQALLPPPFGEAPRVQTTLQLMQSMVNAVRSVVIAPDGSPTAFSGLVLILDDVHWADRDSLDLLELLTRRLESVPLLVVITYRSENVHRRHPLYDLLPALQRDRPVESAELSRLDREDTVTIAEAMHGPCSQQLIDSLHARSEGNPFFLVELLRDLGERRVLAYAEGVPAVSTSGERLPSVLEQVIMGRVGRLGDDAEQLLQVAAVMGEAWDFEVIEAVLGWQEERAVRALELALDAQVVVASRDGNERYRFSHGLIREVLYAGQVARRRKNAHARIANFLEEKAPSNTGGVATLARHFSAAELWEQALRYSVEAGDSARDQHANRGALQFYELALEILPRVSEVARERKVALYDRLGQARLLHNQLETARTAFEQMVQAAQAGGNREAEGQGLLWLSLVQSRLSQTKDACATGGAAIQVAKQAENVAMLAASHWNLGRLSIVSGELERVPAHLAEAERLARLEGDRMVLGRCLMDQARLSNWTGEYQRAVQQAHEGLALAHAEYDSHFLAGLCWMLGIARGELGQYSQALDELQQGFAYAQEADDLHYPVKLGNTTGWLHSEIGDMEAAVWHDQQALETSRQMPANPIREAECYCLLNLATDSLQMGDLNAAERYLREFETADQGIEYARFHYVNRYQLARAQLALAYGDFEGARRWAQDAGEIASAKGMQKNVVKSWMLSGQAFSALRQTPEAVSYLHRSMALAGELRHGSLRWQTRLRLSQAQMTARQESAAATVIQEARDLVATITAELPEGRLRDAFTGSTLVREVYALQEQAPKPVYPAGLTTREVEVLRLVAQGMTNKDIAQALYISAKTVNAHLNSIFIKIDCSNRAGAVAFAFQYDLV